jgi:dolichol-phosphate mannosyltransferase
MSNFNQALEVEKFLEEMKKFWPIHDAVFVDDGSTDGSDLLAEKHGFKVIRHNKNKGAGAAVRSGILWAKENGYDAIVIMSSNGKMRPCDIERVVAPVREGRADYVTGNRYLRQGGMPGLSLFRRVAIPLFSVFASLLIGKWFSDITNGFRCYKIDFLFEPDVDISQEWLEQYELEYYIHYYAVKKKKQILSVPVVIRYDHLEKKRKSKIRPFVGWWSMIRPLLLLRLSLRR